MYRITWTDDGVAKSVDVTTSRAVKAVVHTLQRIGPRITDVEVVYNRPGFWRELVLKFSDQ